MSGRYERGRRFEWRVRRLLEERGYVVVRAAASRPVDLVALKPGEVLLVECKYNARLTSQRRLELVQLAERAGGKAVLARKKRGERSIEFKILGDAGMG